MPKSIIVEGKTTAEAIEKGLEKLKATKNMVEIKTIEEEKKRSFYSILAPRVVKIEMTLKEGFEKFEKTIKKPKREINKNLDEIEKISEKIKEFFVSILDENCICDVTVQDYCVNVKIDGKNISHLIGYRGMTINAFQTIASAIANKNSSSKIMVVVDVGNYREKREKTLEELAEKISERVIKTKKSVTLDPMSAYERKIIHTKLQNSDKVKTFSKGEEPHRRIVITLK